MVQLCLRTGGIPDGAQEHTLSTLRVCNEAHFISFCCRAQLIRKTQAGKGGEIRRTPAMHDSKEIQQHSLPFPRQVTALRYPKSLYTSRLQAGTQALVKIHEKQTCNPEIQLSDFVDHSTTTGLSRALSQPCLLQNSVWDTSLVCGGALPRQAQLNELPSGVGHSAPPALQPSLFGLMSLSYRELYCLLLPQFALSVLELGHSAFTTTDYTGRITYITH